MKIAFSCTDKDMISKSFDISRSFTLCEISCSSVHETSVFEAALPSSVKEMAGAMAFLLAGKGAEAVAVKSIDEKNRLSLLGNGIKVYMIVSDTIQEAINEFISGKAVNNSEMGKCECKNKSQ